MNAQSWPEPVEAILDTEGLRVRRVMRNGPRYWVGRVSRDHFELILKVVISDEPWLSPVTKRQFRPSDQLRTEIRALRRLGQHAGAIAGSVPEVVAAGTGDQPWSLRELVHGTEMAATPGPFIFSERFFESFTPATVIDYILSYQQLTPMLDDIARASPRTDQTDLQSKLVIADLANPQGQLAGIGDHVVEFLMRQRTFYDAHRTKLTHGEFYPPHVFEQNGRPCLIDWENICLDSPLTDFAAVWVRSFVNEPWQQAFVAELESRVLSEPELHQLWTYDRVYHGAGAINYLHWSQIETPAQKLPLMQALRSWLVNALEL